MKSIMHAAIADRCRSLLPSPFSLFLFPPQVAQESVSSCGTRKLLVRLADGLEVESVVIPDLSGSRLVQRSRRPLRSARVGVAVCIEMCALLGLRS